MSAITLGELNEGIARLPAGKRRKGLESWFDGLLAAYGSRIVPVDAEVAKKWGSLSGALRDYKTYAYMCSPPFTDRLVPVM